MKEYEELAKELEAAGGRDAIHKKLQAVEDKSSAEYFKLRKIYYSEDRIKNYKELMDRIDALVKALPADMLVDYVRVYSAKP